MKRGVHYHHLHHHLTTTFQPSSSSFLLIPCLFLLTSHFFVSATLHSLVLNNGKERKKEVNKRGNKQVIKLSKRDEYKDNEEPKRFIPCFRVSDSKQ